MRVRYSFSSRKTGTIDPFNRHKQSVPDIVKHLLQISDVVLEVLDARFIEDTRNAEMEALVKEYNKKLVYVINKVDLATAEQIGKEKLKDLYPYVLVSCKDRKGIRKLRERIKIEAKRELKEKNFERAHIGVVGYPNTGKSSIINYLSGKGSAGTSPMPGYTKGIQKIRLAKGIFLIDTPGVMPLKEDTKMDSEVTKKHAKIGIERWDRIRNPEMAVDSIFKANKVLFEKFYGVDSENDSEIFIEKLGRKRSLVKRGNVVASDRVARLILREWQEGKIRL